VVKTILMSDIGSIRGYSRCHLHPPRVRESCYMYLSFPLSLSSFERIDEKMQLRVQMIPDMFALDSLGVFSGSWFPEQPQDDFSWFDWGGILEISYVNDSKNDSMHQRWEQNKTSTVSFSYSQVTNISKASSILGVEAADNRSNSAQGSSRTIHSFNEKIGLQRG
jgi:hypothetical protein